MVDSGEGIRKGSKICVDIVSCAMSLRKATDKDANSGPVEALECKSCILESWREPTLGGAQQASISLFLLMGMTSQRLVVILTISMFACSVICDNMKESSQKVLF